MTDALSNQTLSTRGRKKEERLSKEDWLKAGLKILATAGPGGLRIDQICKALKVTKGSFYWHFQDRQDLMESLFSYWRERETTGFTDYVLQTIESPRERLWYVVEFVTMGDYDVSLEIAMRQWAQGDDKVRAWLESVDSDRLNFFETQFQDLGLPRDEARLRALSLYSITLIRGFMMTGESKDQLHERMRASLDMLLP